MLAVPAIGLHLAGTVNRGAARVTWMAEIAETLAATF